MDHFPHQRGLTNYRVGISWAPAVPSPCRLESVSHLYPPVALMLNPETSGSLSKPVLVLLVPAGGPALGELGAAGAHSQR